MGDRQKRLAFELRVGDTSFSPATIFGTFLIIAGSIIFIDNLAIFRFRMTRLIWPITLIAYGFVMGLRTRSRLIQIWSGAAVVGGVLMILRDLEILYIRGVIWPLGLIATGLAMLTHRLNWRPLESRISVGGSNDSQSSEHLLRELALFGQVKRRVESRAFEGGELAATFGGVEIDLRRAEIGSENRRAVLETNAIFGGIELRVPEHWRVVIEGNAVFGQFEDKTIPPRPEPGIVSPMLIIRGGVAFGAVVLLN